MGRFGSVAVVAAALVLWFLVRRANEVFFVSVRDGRTLLIRGALPPTLHHALADVVLRTRTRRASLRAVRRDRRAMLEVAGTDPATAQRLRNVFDSHGGPQVSLSQAPPSRRNLGQRLGWVWLAWRLHGAPSRPEKTSK